MTALLRRPWVFPVLCIVAAALVIGAYSNSFQNSFHFDDSHVVENNLYIRSLSNLPLIFRDASTGSSYPPNQVYRPLMVATLALDYWLGGGLDVRQFHLTQLTLLVILGVMVFFMFARLIETTGARWWNRHAALLAAALFTVHATNTETMNIIAVRAELLSAIGIVGSFLAWFHIPASRRTLLYLLPMAIGALAKSPAVIFAPLFLVYLVLFEQGASAPDLFASRTRRKFWAALRTSLPAFIIGAGVFLAISRMDSPAATYGGGDRLAYLRTQFYTWLNYGRLFVLPLGLSADTDLTLIPNWYDTRVIAGMIFIAFLAWAIWKSSTSPVMRPATFGLAWFCVALVPASSIIPLAEVTNDHRVFFPYIGLALAAVWSLAQLAERWAKARSGWRRLVARSAVALVVLAIAGNAVGTYVRNQAWLNGETLWRDVTEKSPGNGRGWMNYGLTQMAKGRYTEAKALFDRAANLTPNYGTLEINLGIVTAALGQPEAESHFARALQLQPNDPGTHTFYASWLVKQGRVNDAIGHLEQAVRLSPGGLDARSQLLALYAQSGRAADARTLATDTLARVPGEPTAQQYLDLGAAAFGTLPARPDGPSASDYLNQSLQRNQEKNYQGSIAAAKKALELKPDYAEAYNNIAVAYASLGKWDDAIVAANEALRLKPDFTLARNNLAWAESEKLKANQPAK